MDNRKLLRLSKRRVKKIEYPDDNLRRFLFLTNIIEDLKKTLRILKKRKRKTVKEWREDSHRDRRHNRKRDMEEHQPKERREDSHRDRRHNRKRNTEEHQPKERREDSHRDRRHNRKRDTEVHQPKERREDSHRRKTHKRKRDSDEHRSNKRRSLYNNNYEDTSYRKELLEGIFDDLPRDVGCVYHSIVKCVVCS